MSHHGDALSLRSGWVELMGVTDQVCQPAPELPMRFWAWAAEIVAAAKKATDRHYSQAKSDRSELHYHLLSCVTFLEDCVLRKLRWL
jgi:hypothetical protein